MDSTTYTEEELAWWVRLLTKRASLRSSAGKTKEDLKDASRYQRALISVRE